MGRSSVDGDQVREIQFIQTYAVLLKLLDLYISAEIEIEIIVPRGSLGQQPPPAGIDPPKVPQPRPLVREW